MDLSGADRESDREQPWWELDPGPLGGRGAGHGWGQAAPPAGGVEPRPRPPRIGVLALGLLLLAVLLGALLIAVVPAATRAGLGQ